MNKNTKSSIILASLASIAVAGSVIAGSTYALFTSEAKANIAVTSGKVSVVATIDENTIKTRELYETEWTDGKNDTFEGKVEFDEHGNLSLENIVPGDAIKFDIVVKNESTVSVKYRTIIKAPVNTGLFEGLTVKVNDTAYSGNTIISDYAELTTNSLDSRIPVEIELPEEKENEYQDKTCTISFTVEAIQGNALVENPSDSEYFVYTPTDLTLFAQKVDAGTFTYTDVIFKDNIDMSGYKYISPTYDSNTVYSHDLNINGNGYTIFNFTPSNTTSGVAACGLLGRVFSMGASVSVTNLKFDTVTIDKVVENIDTNSGAGVIVGFSDSGKVNISDVTVKDVTISNVKYAGGLVGYSSGTTNISNVVLNNVNVKGYTAGGVIGQVGGGTTSIDTFSGSVNVDAYKREGGVVGAVSGSTLTISNYVERDYSAAVDGEVIDGGVSGPIVGLNSGTVTVNGDPLE